MANKEHLAILKKGVQAWNDWRNRNLGLWPNLVEANLQDMDLSGFNFFTTDLRDADLSNCNLFKGNFSGSILIGTDLTNADLRYADLYIANLNGAKMTGAKLDFARIGITVLVDNDLRGVQGLENITHYGPSHIGVDTIYRSEGDIPESFLRGCGMPDEFITFIPSIIGAQQAIQFYSCFISYSTKDEEFARRLYSRMRDEGLRVWFAPEEMKGGQKTIEQLERAIQVHDRLLIVLSEQSMQSEWVMTEIRKARKAEIKENRRKLFPIRLVDFDAIRKWKCFDADMGKDLAVEVREYHIPDFSKWKEHDPFEKAFDRLLRNLKAEEGK